MKTIFVLIASVAFLVTNAQDSTLKVATYQYADNNRIKNIQPLAEHIAQQTGLKVEVKSYATVYLLIDAIQNNEVDVALINTFGFFLLEASSKPYPMKPYMALQVKPGSQDNYKTVIFTQQSCPIDSLSELPKIASSTNLYLVNPGSTSGNLVPRLALTGIGIAKAEESFNRVSYGQNHSLTVEAISKDATSIGAVGHTAYYQYINNPAHQIPLKVLWTSPEIPLGPMLLNNKIKQSIRDSIIAVCQQLHNTNPSALQAVKNGWTEAKEAERFIPITTDYYLPFKKQLGHNKDVERILQQFTN